MATSHVVQDRNLIDRWAIKIEDGQLAWTSTAGGFSPDPIMADDADASSHWIVFIDSGQIGISATTIVRDDEVVLEDSGNVSYKIFVEDGQLGWGVFIRRQLSFLTLRSFITPWDSLAMAGDLLVTAFAKAERDKIENDLIGTGLLKQEIDSMERDSDSLQ